MSRLATRTAAVVGAAACLVAGGLFAVRGGDAPGRGPPAAGGRRCGPTSTRSRP